MLMHSHLNKYLERLKDEKEANKYTQLTQQHNNTTTQQTNKQQEKKEEDNHTKIEKEEDETITSRDMISTHEWMNSH